MLEPWEAPDRRLVKDSAFTDPIAMMLCEHPNPRKFTFKDGCEIILCPDCGLEKGQACLWRPTPWKSE